MNGRFAIGFLDIANLVVCVARRAPQGSLTLHVVTLLEPMTQEQIVERLQ